MTPAATRTMGRLEPARRALVGEISDRLHTLTPEGGSVLREVVPDLNRLLEADLSLAHGVTVAENRVLDLQMLARTPALRSWMVDAWLGSLRGLPPTYGLYDASRPEPRQRNRALRYEDLDDSRGAGTALRPIICRLGLGSHDQIRVLICDGPSLLAWVGGYRRGSFGPSEKIALQFLVPGLRRRLRLERQLGEQQLRAAALPVAMEAISAPAFLLDGHGRVLHANAAGRALLEVDRVAALADLRTGVGYSVARVEASGQRAFALAVRQAAPVDVAPKVVEASRRWGLSPREGQVLALLARGTANKTIASALRVSEGTVEAHVTHLLHKAQAESRAALVADFWSGHHRQRGDNHR